MDHSRGFGDMVDSKFIGFPMDVGFLGPSREKESLVLLGFETVSCRHNNMS